MIPITDGRTRIPCTRREFCRIGGGLAISGFALSGGSGGLATAAGSDRSLLPRGAARSCILVYLLGGPPHLDMWDLKPERPPRFAARSGRSPRVFPGSRSANISRVLPGWLTSSRSCDRSVITTIITPR